MKMNKIYLILFLILISGCSPSELNINPNENNIAKPINLTELKLNNIKENLNNLNHNYSVENCTGVLSKEKYTYCINIYSKISNLTDEYNLILNGSNLIVEEIKPEIKTNIEVKNSSSEVKIELPKEKIEIKKEEPKYSNYLFGKKTIKMKYVLRGKTDYINFEVYSGLNNYYENLDRSISYYYTPPTNKDFALKMTDDEMQLYFIKQLAEKIQNKTSNKDDQVRIAISLVQQLPYDWDSFESNNLESRYPYQVLYDETGVCGEKTKLTAILLRELNYGVVLFTYEIENHEAIGIKCPSNYDYQDSGYCFVETTTPSIITDSEGDYVGAGKLNTIPEIILISEGNSFESVSEEYNDKNEYKRLTNKGEYLSQSDYNKWQKIVNKYGFIFD